MMFHKPKSLKSKAKSQKPITKKQEDKSLNNRINNLTTFIREDKFFRIPYNCRFLNHISAHTVYENKLHQASEVRDIMIERYFNPYFHDIIIRESGCSAINHRHEDFLEKMKAWDEAQQAYKGYLNSVLKDLKGQQKESPRKRARL